MSVSKSTKYATDANVAMNRENNQFNAEQAELNRLFQADMQSQQMQWNEDMWNKQNEYNEQQYLKYETPEAKVRQLQEAGINPNMAMAGTSNFPAAQPVGSSSSPSGSSASSGSGNVSSPGVDGFDRLVSALDKVFSNGMNATDFLFGISQKKADKDKTYADARLANANAAKQEIENDRERSYDSSVRNGLVINPKTGELRLAGSDGASLSDGFEPLIRSSNYNAGSLRAESDLSSHLTKLDSDGLQRMKVSFEKLVQAELPDMTVQTRHGTVSAAKAIAMLSPYTISTVISNLDKTDKEIEKIVQDTDTSKSTSELNKSLSKKASRRDGLAGAVQDLEENGLSWTTAVGVVDAVISKVPSLRK